MKINNEQKEFYAVVDSIVTYIFLKNKNSYLNELNHNGLTAIFFRTRDDYFDGICARLRGMSSISERKYGIYNKAIDGNNLFKVFPWIKPYK